jgi:prepilin-type N-terminal cleavage/methylation domain-containing protein
MGSAGGGVRALVERSCRHPEGSRGFSLAEILVVLGMIGVLSAASVPYFLMYWQSARIRTSAEELAALINEGRQTAIAHNCAVTVVQAANRVQFQLATGCPQPTYCASLPCNWRGPGTDSNGNFRLAGDMQVSAASGSVVFNYLGAAVTPATYTVRDPRTGRTLSVVVARAGRVSIQ